MSMNMEISILMDYYWNMPTPEHHVKKKRMKTIDRRILFHFWWHVVYVYLTLSYKLNDMELNVCKLNVNWIDIIFQITIICGIQVLSTAIFLFPTYR